MDEPTVRQLVTNMMDDLKNYKQQTDNKLEKHETRMDKQDERMDKMNDTQIRHGEQIAGILETLKTLKEIRYG